MKKQLLKITSKYESAYSQVRQESEKYCQQISASQTQNKLSSQIYWNNEIKKDKLKLQQTLLVNNPNANVIFFPEKNYKSMKIEKSIQLYSSENTYYLPNLKANKLKQFAQNQQRLTTSLSQAATQLSNSTPPQFAQHLKFEQSAKIRKLQSELRETRLKHSNGRDINTANTNVYTLKTIQNRSMPLFFEPQTPNPKQLLIQSQKQATSKQKNQFQSSKKSFFKEFQSGCKEIDSLHVIQKKKISKLNEYFLGCDQKYISKLVCNEKGEDNNNGKQFFQFKTQIIKRDVFQQSRTLSNFKVQQIGRSHQKNRFNTEFSLNERLIKKKIGSNFETVKKLNQLKQWRKIILVINNYNLIDFNTKNNLQLCYIDIPIANEMKSEKQVNQEFKEMLEKVKKKFNINALEIYVFNIQGEQINSLLEIKKEQFAIIISSTPLFKGLNNNLKTTKLLQIICNLEEPCKRFDQFHQISPNIKQKCTKTIEKRLQSEYKDVIKDLVGLIEVSNDLNSKMLNNFHSKIKKAVKSKEKLSNILSKEGEQLEQQIKKSRTESNVSLVPLAKLNGTKLDSSQFDSEEMQFQPLSVAEKEILSGQPTFCYKIEVKPKQEEIGRAITAENKQKHSLLQEPIVASIRKSSIPFLQINPKNQTVAVKILNQNSRMQYKTQAEYFDENNLTKPLMQSKNTGLYDACYAYYRQKNEREVPQDSDDELEQYEEEAKQKQRLLNEESLSKIADKLEILLKKWYFECTSKYSVRQQKILQKKTAYLFSTNENSVGSREDSKNSIEIQENENKENFISQLKSNTLNQRQFHEIEVKFPEALNNEKEQINYVEQNKQQAQNKKSFLNEIRGINREIFLQNIPKILKDTHFDRRDLHNIYILYKTLHEVTSQRYPHANYSIDIQNGLDFDTFRNGIYHIFVQSEELAQKIFSTTDINELGQLLLLLRFTQTEGFLNWENFLQLMVSIKAKTLREKIDLFIKICDEDGNGMLSEEEIINLSKVCLSKYICQSEGSEEFLDDLCQYFADLIFNSVGYNKDEEIPLKDIKNAILYDNNKEQALLTMFCGADI